MLCSHSESNYFSLDLSWSHLGMVCRLVFGENKWKIGLRLGLVPESLVYIAVNMQC